MVYITENQALNFKHVTLSDKMSSGKVNPRRATVCELVEVFPRQGSKPSFNVAYEAIAACDSRDSFNKEKGRKSALKKVLKNAGYTREQRTTVWNAYFNR